MSLEKYIKQYEEMSAQNPMDPRERYFYMGKSNGEHCLVLTDISIFDDTIHISSIQTRPAGECEGKGFASEVLGKLVKLADENDVIMSLDPTPFAQATIDSEGLERWYARNGFVDDPEFGGMRRTPRVSEATRKPRKKGQRRKSSKHSDLYTDEDPKGTIKGLGFKDAATARKGVATVNKANRTHAHKVQATLVMVQRGKVAIERTKDPEKKKNLRAANKIWSAHLEKLKKKTKQKNESVREYIRVLLEQDEGSRDSLVVVDVQPEYESNTRFNIGDMLRTAAEDYSRVLFLFNGEDTLGMVSESALKNFYFEKLDYDEETFDKLLSKSTFFDKGYGFFRDVMDSSVCFDRTSIVKIVKHMIDNDIQDIRDLEEEDVDAIGVSELLFDDLEDYGFYLPELEEVLPRWNGSDLAGGARNECMAEVEILGAAQGLSFNHVDRFIYEGDNRYTETLTETFVRTN
ncbi:MAG: hypothetical protein CMA72_07130 [Euryarchaeota archaeon]|nr:hypothetical protein [Euryarchaeota archaeon]|tara:strand:+ start:45017 stop:46399 length:1383 start_codon:yes stop_codon:yes gene_type:complete